MFPDPQTKVLDLGVAIVMAHFFCLGKRSCSEGLVDADY